LSWRYSKRLTRRQEKRLFLQQWQIANLCALDGAQDALSQVKDDWPSLGRQLKGGFEYGQQKPASAGFLFLK